jgi:hypothetical protein
MSSQTLDNRSEETILKIIINNSAHNMYKRREVSVPASLKKTSHFGDVASLILPSVASYGSHLST